jgi:BirA family biotin operon repressor/biotin-[acetyl-CoA-carboxylase] ligase
VDLAGVDRALCARRALAQELRFVAECSSTSDLLREDLLAGGPTAQRSVLLVAGRQTSGRGRRERDWWSGPDGANLACTLSVLDPPEPALLLSLAAACALAATVARRVQAPVALKWPNDLLVGGAKVAGLLGEVPAVPRAGAGAGGAVDAIGHDGPDGQRMRPVALVGLGVNVAAAPPTDEAAYPTTRLVDHGRFDLEGLLIGWLWGLERRLARLRIAGPADLEAECLNWLRAWAPNGVQASGGGTAGPLLEFSVSGGLLWGREGATKRLPLGQVPELKPL